MIKKVLLILSVLITIIALGCSNQQSGTVNAPEQGKKKSVEVETVERLIGGIGEVTLEKEKYIIDAETAYDELYEIDKAEVSNYEHLLLARQKYNELLNEREKEIDIAISKAQKLVTDNDIKQAIEMLDNAKELAITDEQLTKLNNTAELLSLMLYDNTSVVRLECVYPFINEYKVKYSNENADYVYIYTFNTNNSTSGDYSDSLSTYKEYMDKHFSLISTEYNSLNAADVFVYSSIYGEEISISRYAKGYPVVGYFAIRISKPK